MAASRITSMMNKTQKTIGIKMTKVIEDNKMNQTAFDYLINNSYDIKSPVPANSGSSNSSTSIVDLCPMAPNNNVFQNPFGNISMPNLSCGPKNKTVNNTSSAPLIK